MKASKGYATAISLTRELGLCDALASPVGVHADDLTGLETALLLTFACNDAGDPVTVPKCPGVNVETGNRPITVFSNERDPVCLFSFRHRCTIREKVRYSVLAWQTERSNHYRALSCLNE